MFVSDCRREFYDVIVNQVRAAAGTSCYPARPVRGRGCLLSDRSLLG